MKIPQLSVPLAKSIRTGEGILIYASNLLLGVLAVVPHGLSWQRSALYITSLNGLHLIARTALKASAVNAGLGIAPPIPFNPIAAGSVQALVDDATEFADVPPAQQGPPPIVQQTPPATQTSTAKTKAVIAPAAP